MLLAIARALSRYSPSPGNDLTLPLNHPTHRTINSQKVNSSGQC